METPVYKLFFFRRSPQAYHLSPDELRQLTAQAEEHANRLHVRQLLVANMRWSNERYQYFGVELFPGQDAQLEYTTCLEEMGWYRYVEGESFLGLPLDGTANNLTPPELPRPEENPVYRVYLSRLTTYGHELKPERLSDMWALGRDAREKVGGVQVLGGYLRWNNEEWDSFGIERFPGTEAVLSYSQYLSVSGWYRVSEARSYLGLAVSGLISGIG